MLTLQKIIIAFEFDMAGSLGFISKNHFTSKAEDQTVLKWNELVEGVIYKITNIEVAEGKFGPCSILHIVDKDANRKRVWGPSQIINNLIPIWFRKHYFDMS